jgi:hypothetical protein
MAAERCNVVCWQAAMIMLLQEEGEDSVAFSLFLYIASSAGDGEHRSDPYIFSS